MGGIKEFHLKGALKKLGQVKTWQFLLVLLPLLFITATLYRFDHIKMTELKAAVLQADEENDDVKIAETLDQLKTFAFSHTIINVVEKNGGSYITFGTGPFYLEHQYQRKAEEALNRAREQAGTDENPNGNVFANAMAVCEPQAAQNGWVWTTYLACVNSEVAKYPVNEQLVQSYNADLPSTNLFRYDFASPVWTFSLSGFTALVSAILIVVIFIRFLIWCVLRLALIFLK